MIGHLGNRVSALLDGQLPAREAEEAWAHVYSCHVCRDLVEREGWVKTRLAGLSEERCAPSGLKGSLLSMPPGDAFLAGAEAPAGSRRALGVAVIGGSAVGAAVVGVLALGFAPGSAPPVDRRPPVTQITTPSSPSPSPAPVSHRGAGSTPTPAVRAPARRLHP